MSKPVAGLIAGIVLGLIDGATAWFTPQVRSQLGEIMMGSAMKGMIVGLVAGWYARKVQSEKKGILLGAALGLFLAFLVAAMPQPDGTHFWLQIMLPGFITGGIIGFLTQRCGAPAQGASSAQ
ncbi:hypothetical protein F183_A34680 [Bryobacterales bacterium F-183]|nr:hypothetical protein F183_A34680 [Bryobacterales bacterium F-183]